MIKYAFCVKLNLLVFILLHGLSTFKSSPKQKVFPSKTRRFFGLHSWFFTGFNFQKFDHSKLWNQQNENSICWISTQRLKPCLFLQWFRKVSSVKGLKLYTTLKPGDFPPFFINCFICFRFFFMRSLPFSIHQLEKQNYKKVKLF